MKRPELWILGVRRPKNNSYFPFVRAPESPLL
jgi:hypothetical protein